ncbi:MAG TPA: cupin domain-containing protein [Bacillota bacterium]|nr:cupin domain-containing protein [Bacillota bacterium]
MTIEATRFSGGGPRPETGLDIKMLVDGGAYDVRRVLAAPGERHGPGRHGGDACVCVLAGSVRFEVGGAGHELGPGDILWVPADVLRGFEAGPAGAELLAVHLPRRCLS